MNEVERKIAFKAMSRRARRLYQVVAEEIERSGVGKVLITTYGLTTLLGISSTASLASSVRELIAMGLVTVEPGYRGARVFSLASAWRDIVDLEAAKLATDVARKSIVQRPYTKPGSRVEPNNRRKAPEPVVPEAMEPELHGQRPISLAMSREP